jgi:hypothetical protein
MSTRRFFTIIILLLITLFTSYSSIPAIPMPTRSERANLPSFVWESYTSRTFHELFNSNTLALTGSEPIYLSLEMHRSRVQATFTGQRRPISELRTAVIAAWFKENQADSRYKKLFTTEWLFLAEGKEYWLPVQATSADYMVQEFHEGDDITLLVVLLGAHKNQNGMDWLFVVNEVMAN